MAEVVAELLPRNFHNDFNEDDEVIGINVRRTFLVADALREGGKKKFKPGKKLKVCICGVC